MNAAELFKEIPRLSEEQRERALQLKARIEALEAELSVMLQSPNASVNALELRDRGINEVQAADLRSRLQTFAEDWDRPEAAIYDEDTAR